MSASESAAASASAKSANTHIYTGPVPDTHTDAGNTSSNSNSIISSSTSTSTSTSTNTSTSTSNSAHAKTNDLLFASDLTCHWCDQVAFSMMIHAFPLDINGERFIEDVGTLTAGDTKEITSMPLCRLHESQFCDVVRVDSAVYKKQLTIDPLSDASLAACSSSNTAWRSFLLNNSTGRKFALSGEKIVRDYISDDDDEVFDDPPHCRVCRLAYEGGLSRDLNKVHSIGFGRAAPIKPTLLSQEQMQQVQFKALEYWCEKHVDDMLRTLRIYNIHKPNLSMPEWDDPNYVDPTAPRLPNQ